nr:transposase [Poseidonocella sp. HB161398]
MRLDPEMAWHVARTRRRSRPETVSNSAIRTCPTLKIRSGLPGPQTADVAAGQIKMTGLDWPVQDFPILCRRPAGHPVQIAYRHAGDAPTPLIGRTGIRLRVD